MHKTIKHLFFIAIVLTFHNCKLYKNPPETTEIAKESVSDSLFIQEYWSQGVSDTIPVEDNWYKNFNNTQLDSLINEAIDSTNLNVIFQLAGIDAAKAQVILAKSGRKIQLNYSGGFSGFYSSNTNTSTSVSVSAPLSWELDLWGKVGAGVKAADENLISKMYDFEYTKQSIAGIVSNLYFEIGAINKKLTLGQEFIELNENISKILRRKQAIGIINYQDIHLNNSNLNSIKAIVEDNRNLLQKKIRELETIIGRYPENKLQVNWNIEPLEPITQINNPFGLIDRRPDVKSNETRLRALFYLTEQAKLAKYPSLVLTSKLSLSSLSDMVISGNASILGPIFNGGALNGLIEEATAEQKQAAANYGLSIINAFKEVETSLNSQTILSNQVDFTDLSAEQSKKAYNISLRQYEIGRIGLFDVLQIQLQWLTRELDLIIVNQAVYQERIQLYLALGGNIIN